MPGSEASVPYPAFFFEVGKEGTGVLFYYYIDNLLWYDDNLYYLFPF